jgi:hypothetical protein
MIPVPDAVLDPWRRGGRDIVQNIKDYDYSYNKAAGGGKLTPFLEKQMGRSKEAVFKAIQKARPGSDPTAKQSR